MGALLSGRLESITFSIALMRFTSFELDQLSLSQAWSWATSSSGGRLNRQSGRRSAYRAGLRYAPQETLSSICARRRSIFSLREVVCRREFKPP